MMQKVLVIHGPNLNLLGEREPGVYGNTTFADLNRMILDRAEGLGLECEIFQSNHEVRSSTSCTLHGIPLTALSSMPGHIPTTAMPFMMLFTTSGSLVWKYISATFMHGTSFVPTLC